jgi:hypothetical protein
MNFGNTTFEAAPTGVHRAKLFSIVDLGTQTGTYEGKPTVNRQLHFTWELVDETKDDGTPYTISKFYNQSLGERANFILDMTSWLGKAPAIPTDGAAKAQFVLDLLKSLLGKGCQLVIVDKEGKHKISTITGLGKTDKLPDGTVNEVLFFDLDNFDEDVYEKVPKGIQGIIQKSPEYGAVINGPAVEEAPEEEIPF